MGTFDSLTAWTTPERPSTASYVAIARYAARSRGLAVLAFTGVPLAVQIVSGQYALAVLVVGSLVGCAVALFAGVAVAFDDAGVAVLATAGTAVALAATAGVVWTFGLADAQLLGIVFGVVVAPGAFAVAVAGYTVGERAVR